MKLRRIKYGIERTDQVILVLILAIGALLRFYRLGEIPFTHDEFSAIIRAQYDTLGDLISKGVRIDGHPAGVQVFIWLWIKWFGVSEAALKTPFIIFGLLSIWLIYLVGRDWFSPTVGLLAASFMSFLQFPVMYSQIARPYASGLFFTLLMVWFWTRILFFPDRKYWLNLAGYVVAGTLCAYNHHFSMLFAAMVGITGLFFCRQKAMLVYLASGVAILALYIPHLSIFFYQLSVGGIEGWLQKPRFDFIADFVQYIFHFSIYIYLLILVLFSLSLYWYREKPRIDTRFVIISLVWFILPFLVGYLYSTYRNAVLQYSVLIFSFPYLLFLPFALFKGESSKHKIIVVALTALVVIPSLVVERRHYELFYKAPYREMVMEARNAVASLGADRCLVILDTRKEINPYYLERLNCRDLPFIYASQAGTRGRLLSLLDTCRKPFLAYGCVSAVPWENYQLMNSVYPYLLMHKSYAGGDFYLFSRRNYRDSDDPEPDTAGSSKGVLNEYFYSNTNGFEPSPSEWGWIRQQQVTDTLPIAGKRSFSVWAGQEFSPTFTMPLRDLIHGRDDVIDASVDLRLPEVFPGGWLVMSVTSNGRDVYWNSASVADYLKPGRQGRVYMSLRMSDIELRHHGLQLSVFIWNPAKSPYILDNFTIRVRRGNPVIYGLYRIVED